MARLIAVKQKQCAAGELPKSQIWTHLSLWICGLWERKTNQCMNQTVFYILPKQTQRRPYASDSAHALPMSVVVRCVSVNTIHWNCSRKLFKTLSAKTPVPRFSVVYSIEKKQRKKNKWCCNNRHRYTTYLTCTSVPECTVRKKMTCTDVWKADVTVTTQICCSLSL